MITVTTFLWFDPKGRCNDVYVYGPEHVYALRRMVARNLGAEHEFVCVTDRPEAFDGSIRTIGLDRTMHVPGTRFAKLMLFRPDIASIIGQRMLYLDLDTVVVGGLDAIAGRSEDLVLWRNPNFGIPKRAFYNTSMILLRAGARPEFWIDFDPKTTPAMLKGTWGGTDQAWVSHRASRDEAHWTAADGVYGAGRLGDAVPGAGTSLPEGARIVFFPGRREPSMASVQERHPWIAEHRT